jgi:hypothetical protein
MGPAAVTRRVFIASSAGAVATLAVAAMPKSAQADTSPSPVGAVYGRVGRQGISPGTATAPATGKVVLLDGQTLDVPHVHRFGIRAGASVLLGSDAAGGWTILYVEHLDQ